jgi:ubiquinone biosynthesis protein Coq4
MKKIKKFRESILVFLTHRLALPLLKKIRKPEVFPHSITSLASFDEGTLGKALADFLLQKNLPLLSNYARHDIKHIILEYDTTEEGEVCLQCFMLGNGHLSIPVAATVLYGFFTMPEYWPSFYEAIIRGKRSAKIHGWMWMNLLREQVGELQLLVNVSK